MQKFTLEAHKVYAFSKCAFYSLIPDCETSFVHGTAQLMYNLKVVARDGKKEQRRNIMALVMACAPEEQIGRIKTWITDYFSAEMQIAIFDLQIDSNRKIIFGKSLERAFNKISNRKR